MRRHRPPGVVLDEIVGNETDLRILEHTTDTAGYSDIVFALFDLLGLSFCPRLRDIADQRLCRIKGKDWHYPALKFTGSVSPEYIVRHWDELLRLAGSIVSGRVTASLFISKLQAYPRQNNLTYVLQAYGQLIKTKRTGAPVHFALSAKPTLTTAHSWAVEQRRRTERPAGLAVFWF